MKRSECSRADLLEALVEGNDRAADYWAAQLGLKLDEPKGGKEKRADENDRDYDSRIVVDSDHDPDLRVMEQPRSFPKIPFWHVVASHFENIEASTEERKPVPAPKVKRTDYPIQKPIAPWQQLFPRLRRLLEHADTTGKVDVERMTERISRAEFIQHLSRQRRRNWGGELQFIVDRSLAMTPYIIDQAELYQKLQKIFPDEHVTLAEYLPGEREPVICTKHLDMVTPYHLPAPGSLVIVCSDMGLFSSVEAKVQPDREKQGYWFRLGQRLQQQQCRPIALIPTSTWPSDHALNRCWRLLPWEHRANTSNPNHDGDLVRLLNLVSPATRVEPGFLREVRQLIGADASVESLFWQHPALATRSCVAAALKSEEAEERRLLFDIEDADVRKGVLQSLYHWRTHLPPEIRYEEYFSLSPACRNLLPDQADLAEAKAFFYWLIQELEEKETIEGIESWLRGLEKRMPEAAWCDESTQACLHGVWALVREKDPSATPMPGYRPEFNPNRKSRSMQRWQVYMHGDALNFIRLEDVKSKGFLLPIKHPAQWEEHWQAKGSWLGEIHSRSGEVVLEEIELDQFWASGKPPTWADAWGEDAFGRWVEFVVEDVRQRMRWMPAGAFLMGSPEGEAERFDREGPQHTVRISQGFWMFDTAVPQGLWLAVMGENPSHFKGDDLPVERVSWEDCQKCIEKINQLLPGLGLSLPSEAQWEYGCRAGTTMRYSFGDKISSEQANYECNVGKTVAVKSYAANPWGLWQMHGNVWERCQDRWHENYRGAPEDGVAWEQGYSARRVVRGGSWSSYGRSLRSAYRILNEPDDRDLNLGFRCARVQVTGQEAAEPIDPGQLRSGTRSAAPDRSGGADSQGRVGSPLPTRNTTQTRDNPGNPQRESTTRRTIIENGGGILQLPPGRDFELRSDMGRLRVQQLTKPEWASAVGRDRYGLWAEFKVEGKKEAVTQRMRWIPPGQFLMGSPEDEAWDNDKQQHSVMISKGYWLFDVPVTQALWMSVMLDSKNPSEFQSPRRPVERVNWEEAHAFMQALNGKVAGLNLCLPSEAQWEYACRAGTTAATYNGAMEVLGELNAPVLDEIAWYGGNSGVGFDLNFGENSSNWSEKQFDHSKAGTREVALKRANDWGLYDMLGNVCERMQDRWHDSYEGAPENGAVWESGEDARLVVRGGSWNRDGRNVCSAFRDYCEPGIRSNDLGFRCAQIQETGESQRAQEQDRE